MQRYATMKDPRLRWVKSNTFKYDKTMLVCDLLTRQRAIPKLRLYFLSWIFYETFLSLGLFRIFIEYGKIFPELLFQVCRGFVHTEN